jgi:hypothetical protein
MGRFIRDIIRSWPTAGDLASDLEMGGRKGTRLVRMWSYRGHIPPNRFPAIVAAAEQRGLEHITLQSLYEANSAGRQTQKGATE